MATIDDVISWANTLPGWQGDTVRRLLVAGDQPLSSQDYSEILALAKAELNLSPLPTGLKSIHPTAGMFSGAPASSVSVRLLSIDNVQNVNIIKSGQVQPFAENGLSVVYGENGSGKSGYSRILKQACQARDKDEKILSNVFETGLIGAPTATLKIKKNGADHDIVWTQGTIADPILTNITVFDGRCARIITDNRNEITYLPFGGDVFQKLAEIVLKVKAEIEAVIINSMPIQDSAIARDSVAGKFLDSLSEKTTDEEIQAAISWTPDDDRELSLKEALLRTSDPTTSVQEITRLDKVQKRIIDAANNVAKLDIDCSELNNDVIERVIQEVNTAQLAHWTAMNEREMPEPLAGVATTSQWEILYKAAKNYSEQIAYPGLTFPKTDSAVCVLCQQPLSGEAIDRLGRFKKYMDDATNAVLTTKRHELDSIVARVNGIIPLTSAPLESICDEVGTYEAKVGDDLRSYHDAIALKRTSILELLSACQDPEKAKLLPEWPVSIETELRRVAASIDQMSRDIFNAAKPDEYKKIFADVVESKSKKALATKKSEIEEYVAQTKRNATLRRIVTSLRTQEITRQGTAVIRKNLTPELIEAFKKELGNLGAVRIPISLKPSGEAGETVHEVLLEGASPLVRAKPSNILSEGEARVIAIAGFMAELQLAPHANAIVMDDPVSSLDHVFTRKIARRLAQEGLKRQVIIFTHNIAFLMELEDACFELALSRTPVGIVVHTLRRNNKLAGITTDGAPWHAMKVNRRAQYLEDLLRQIKPHYQDEMDKYNEYAAKIYGLLREAWESCIEDDLLYNVVCRYRNSVQTLKLNEVAIEDADIHQIELNITKASTWMIGHDKSKALHYDRPAPDELCDDINALRNFSKMVSSRRKQTKSRRDKMLEPASPEESR